MVSRVVTKWLKYIFILSTASFLIIQIQLRRSANPSSDPDSKSIHQSAANEPPIRPNADPELAPAGEKPEKPSTLGMPGLEDIRKSIEDNNAHAEILNEAKFGPVESVEYVIVVQVHNRSKYLDQLIQSMSKAKGIERALVIFSHDYYSAVFNQLIRSMTFCRTMQIFYPYSMQIFPDRFPGQDPKDCPGDIDKDT